MPTLPNLSAAVTLAFTHYPKTGGRDAPPLVLAHGLFGAARNWGAIAKRLAQAGRDVIAVDMRNHAASPWAETHSYADMAADLAQVIAAHGGRADVLGHSMGGKAAMQLALGAPSLVRALVVADMAPVAYHHDQMQNIGIMRGLDLDGLTLRSQADARLAPQVPDPSLRAFFLQSIDFTGEKPVWRLNLDVLAREMPQILGWSGIAGVFDGPTLFLSGGLSDYVQPAHRAIIRPLFPAAHFAKIPQTGHWLHAEKPREFIETVQVFLDAVDTKA